MATHSHRITIDASKEDVFQAITTRDGLQGWYTSSVEGDAGHDDEIKLDFQSKEGPFHWRVNIIKPGATVQWECLEGPGLSAGGIAVFDLAEQGDGRTSVDLDHTGADESDEKTKVCNTMWGLLCSTSKSMWRRSALSRPFTKDSPDCWIEKETL